MPRPKQRPQQMRKLFAHLDDIVPFGLEQFEKSAQVRSGQRWAAAVVWMRAVHQVMHASAEIFRVGWSQRRMMVMQALTSQCSTEIRRTTRVGVQAKCGNRARSGRARPDFQALARAARGKRTMTRVPWPLPFGDSSFRAARCLCATSLTMASPRPAPSPGLPWMR